MQICLGNSLANKIYKFILVNDSNYYESLMLRSKDPIKEIENSGKITPNIFKSK
jgi:hypothetical protein